MFFFTEFSLIIILSGSVSFSFSVSSTVMGTGCSISFSTPQNDDGFYFIQPWVAGRTNLMNSLWIWQCLGRESSFLLYL